MKSISIICILFMEYLLLNGCIVDEKWMYERYRKVIYVNTIQIENKCDTQVFFSVKNFTKEQYRGHYNKYGIFNEANNFKIEPKEWIHYDWSTGIPNDPLPFFNVGNDFMFIVRKKGEQERVYTKDQILSKEFSNDFIVTKAAHGREWSVLSIKFCGNR